MTDKYTQKIIDNKNTITMFYVDWCPYCKAAIKYLKDNKIKFKKYNIEKNGGIAKILQYLIHTKNITKFNPMHKTVPIIFKNGKFIGGFEDLKKIIN